MIKIPISLNQIKIGTRNNGIPVLFCADFNYLNINMQNWEDYINILKNNSFSGIKIKIKWLDIEYSKNKFNVINIKKIKKLINLCKSLDMFVLVALDYTIPIYIKMDINNGTNNAIKITEILCNILKEESNKDNGPIIATCFNFKKYKNNFPNEYKNQILDIFLKNEIKINEIYSCSSHNFSTLNNIDISNLKDFNNNSINIINIDINKQTNSKSIVANIYNCIKLGYCIFCLNGADDFYNICSNEINELIKSLNVFNDFKFIKKELLYSDKNIEYFINRLENCNLLFILKALNENFNQIDEMNIDIYSLNESLLHSTNSILLKQLDCITIPIEIAIKNHIINYITCKVIYRANYNDCEVWLCKEVNNAKPIISVNNKVYQLKPMDKLVIINEGFRIVFYCISKYDNRNISILTIKDYVHFILSNDAIIPMQSSIQLISKNINSQITIYPNLINCNIRYLCKYFHNKHYSIYNVSNLNYKHVLLVQKNRELSYTVNVPSVYLNMCEKQKYIYNFSSQIIEQVINITVFDDCEIIVDRIKIKELLASQNHEIKLDNNMSIANYSIIINVTKNIKSLTPTAILYTISKTNLSIDNN